MNTLNFQVIRSVSEWLEQGDRVFFVTVLKTWGASPRPRGSLFAFNVDQSRQVGSLSGGCIEEDLIQFFEKISLSIATKHACQSENEATNPTIPFLKLYGDKSGDSNRYLLPCGGTLELLIEPILDPVQYQHFHLLKQNLKDQRPVSRVLKCQSKGISYALDTGKQAKVTPDILVFDYENTELYHRLDPSYRLLIVGAGDVTSFVQSFAKSLDFDVSICEPRQQYAQRLTPQECDSEFYSCLPDDLIKKQFQGKNCAIICLAHDPKVDDMALLEALSSSQAFYIGAMGSLTTTENRRLRLKALGLSDEQLERLRAPIGVNIHSKTPPEIAISILAELIASRHEVSLQNPLNC